MCQSTRGAISFRKTCLEHFPSIVISILSQRDSWYLLHTCIPKTLPDRDHCLCCREKINHLAYLGLLLQNTCSRTNLNCIVIYPFFSKYNFLFCLKEVIYFYVHVQFYEKKSIYKLFGCCGQTSILRANCLVLDLQLRYHKTYHSVIFINSYRYSMSY